ncbi:NAD-dependent epimerase/dehydratase family protein [Geminocystis herdmanii]|nr:NAD-dependent epimerase/dehydratase family protein [Geminocystis herdmanii]
MSNIILITGSAGLIGSESVKYFAKLGLDVVGIDNKRKNK